jgi:hypothetical protein
LLRNRGNINATVKEIPWTFPHRFFPNRTSLGR